jgi:CDP-paratose 2-epimerase
MARQTALVTGSSGLIGSEVVAFLDERGWAVEGVDNNMRREFFGEHGDTTWNLERLLSRTRRFHHNDLDVRDRKEMLRLIREHRPQLIVHAAAQPSHDLAASRPFDDFEINAVGTLNLLEAARENCPDSPFVFLSTNKVYGDAPNELELVELETRWDYADPALRDGIDETMRIDATMHSLFGASKVAADVLVQEYGRYFGMPTVCFRGGCLTGPFHSGAELHGFLAYLARALREGMRYRISATRASRCGTISTPTTSAPRSWPSPNTRVRTRSTTLAAAARIAARSWKRSPHLRSSTDARSRPSTSSRLADHICYISALGRFRADYPGWELTISLEEIYAQLSLIGSPHDRWTNR